MKKLAILVTIAAFLDLLVLGGQAIAGPSVHLNWGSQVNPGQCDANPGKLVTNVVHKVINDIDSGEQGNYWAYDNYVKQIQVWDKGAGTFCAVVRYMGDFRTVAGPAPGLSGTVAAGITGTFEGGYRAVITGVLNPSPTERTKGNIGEKDYQGNIAPDGTGTLNPFSWLATYFSSVSGFSMQWWGWIYHAGDNGSWVNSSDGNQGNIQ